MILKQLYIPIPRDKIVCMSCIRIPVCLQALSAALLQVRSDLVETAQQTVEGQARQELQEANVQQLLDKKTAQMQVHID